MSDDRGVLGNLPRSRPGRRSEKRATKVDGAAKPRARRPRPAPPKAPPVREDAAGSSGNPVGGLVRTASSLAGGGVRVARGVAGEVLRRLPRP
jgi:hypothetical protein